MFFQFAITAQICDLPLGLTVSNHGQETPHSYEASFHEPSSEDMAGGTLLSSA